MWNAVPLSLGLLWETPCPLTSVGYVHALSCSCLCKCALPASASWAEQWKLESCLHVLDIGRFYLLSDCGCLALVLAEVNQAQPPLHGVFCLAPCETSTLGTLCHDVGRSGEPAPSGGDHSMSSSPSAEHVRHRS